MGNTEGPKVKNAAIDKSVPLIDRDWEHPKYLLVQILDIIKQAIWEEANRLVANGVLEHLEDVLVSLQEIKK